jgi:hypothetical protein
MSNGYTYVVVRDYGFAPNPFGGLCTLATCKPIVRKHLCVGDHVFGVSPKKQGNRLIYAMQVSEKMSYNQYWNDPRFQYKKPIMFGTKKTAYGDNIYHHDLQSGLWIQDNSHHSYPDGTINDINLKRDTKTTDQVLISDHFFYFGAKMIEIPDEFKSIFTRTINGFPLMQGQKPLTGGQCLPFWNWLCANHTMGRRGFPIKFDADFERYSG